MDWPNAFVLVFCRASMKIFDLILSEARIFEFRI